MDAVIRHPLVMVASDGLRLHPRNAGTYARMLSVVFDPAKIADRATYRSPAEPSVGVRFLLVSGTVVVEEGRVVEGVFPGRGLVTEGRSTP